MTNTPRHLPSPHDFPEQQLPKLLLPPFWEAGADPSYPLGTDHLGRDELSRIRFGARTSLLVGAGGVAIAGALGITLGLLAGSRLNLVVVVLVLATWVQYACVVRGSTLSVKTKEYVEGARASGAGHARILVRHVLPNILGPVVVIATVNVSTLILAEAALSVLGLGVQPPRRPGARCSPRRGSVRHTSI